MTVAFYNLIKNNYAVVAMGDNFIEYILWLIIYQYSQVSLISLIIKCNYLNSHGGLLLFNSQGLEFHLISMITPISSF